MPQEIKGYFLTKQELKSIKYFAEKSVFLIDEFIKEIEQDEKQKLLNELEINIKATKNLLTY